MNDIELTSKLQNLLVEAGFKTSSIATDEDGNNHEIKFEAEHNFGIIYTGEGKICFILGEQL